LICYGLCSIIEHKFAWIILFESGRTVNAS
jgi:hypothetical protein